MSPFVSILCLLFLRVSIQQALGQLITDPVELAVEPGEDAEFTCAWGDGENATKLEVLNWHRITANSSLAGEIMTQLTNSSRLEFRGGVFLIKNVSFADAGRYKCLDDSGTEPVEVKLIVYDMPSYWTEGGILIGLSVALLVVLGLALIKQNYFKKRTKKVARKARQ